MDGGRRPAARVELRDQVRYVLGTLRKPLELLQTSELPRAEPLLSQLRFLPPPLRLDAGRGSPGA